jgi:predicted lysophospholipase L1 biosynthesis ABC-type transport system permease subunit
MATADVAWNDHPAARYVKAQPADGGKALASVGEDGIVWLGSTGKGSVIWCAVAGRLAEQGPLVRWIAEERLLVGSLRWGARHKFTGGTAARRDLWLVSLSLLVCIVGITNAMLMSVTERFREIGTMKCIGALDSFVVRLFLIESSLMGAVGSLAGALVGFLLTFLRSMLSYHVTYNEQSYWLVLRFFPGPKILMWAGIAVAIGAVLSIVAAVYPAYRAARMEPIEAMRAQA